jgi:hypothetical protein
MELKKEQTSKIKIKIKKGTAPVLSTMKAKSF